MFTLFSLIVVLVYNSVALYQCTIQQCSLPLHPKGSQYLLLLDLLIIGNIAGIRQIFSIALIHISLMARNVALFSAVFWSFVFLLKVSISFQFSILMEYFILNGIIFWVASVVQIAVLCLRNSWKIFSHFVDCPFILVNISLCDVNTKCSTLFP